MNNSPQFEDEEGIDIMALVKQLWDGRKTIIIWTCAFIVLGFVAALTMNLGNLALNPYKNAAYAAFYREITSGQKYIAD